MTNTIETIQTLTYGTELEYTHLSRQKAAQAIQSVVGGSIRYEGGSYDTWAVDAPDGRVWKAVADSSLQLRHLTFAIVHAPYRRVTGRRPSLCLWRRRMPDAWEEQTAWIGMNRVENHGGE